MKYRLPTFVERALVRVLTLIGFAGRFHTSRHPSPLGTSSGVGALDVSRRGLFLLCTSLLINLNAQKALFSPTPQPTVEREIAKQLTDFSLIAVDRGILAQIATEKPQKLKLNLPFENGLTLELERQELAPNGLNVYGGTPGRKEQFDYQAGAYYRGQLSNQERSLVAVSFFHDEIIGVIADERGNINLGLLASSEREELLAIAYRDLAHLNAPTIHCAGAEPIPYQETPDHRVSTSRFPAPGCFTEYIEADFSFYQDRGSDMTTAVNWLTGAWNVVAAIYAGEHIVAEISEIFVWTSPDDYDATSTTTGLNDFRDAMGLSDFNGDLAILITRTPGEGGGRAYINTICNDSPRLRTGYARVDSTFAQLPEYSWPINVITHEVGHNLGGRHTHRCIWNGDFTPIDDTGNVWALENDAFIEGNNCFDRDDPILPADGATIMSYGHLIEGIGMNFSKGFDQQPGDVIRSRLSACSNCLPTTDIQGQLTFADGSGLENILVQIEGVGLDTLTTDFAGDFTGAGFLSDSNYLVRPLSPAYAPATDPAINVIDIIQIRRYILGLDNSDLSPYQLLAADVDGNPGVSVGDIIQIVQYILGLGDDFTAGDAWIFVDADYQFTSPASPWEEEWPAYRTVDSPLLNGRGNDFISIQRGDVTGAAED